MWSAKIASVVINVGDIIKRYQNDRLTLVIKLLAMSERASIILKNYIFLAVYKTNLNQSELKMNFV